MFQQLSTLQTSRFLDLVVESGEDFLRPTNLGREGIRAPGGSTPARYVGARIELRGISLAGDARRSQAME